MTVRRLPRWAAVLALFSLLALACSGGSSRGGDDAAAPADGAVAGPGERPVQFVGAGKVRLFGTFTMPETTSRAVPGVLLVPTSGAGDLLGPTGANDPLGQDLAASFAQAGLATYRYDQRGTGESKLEPGVNLTVDDLVADAKAALDLLSQRRETTGQDLSVVGYDQGGLVAMRLAATDDRVKRVVLISTPGRSLTETRAAQLDARHGPESGPALRELVAGLLQTRGLPPLDSMRTELRALFPSQHAAFMADLYGIDPAADAARVRVPALIVVPADPAPYDPQRLAAAMRGAQVLTSTGTSPTLVISGETGPDLSDPTSPLHDHGSGPPVAKTTRDTAALERMAQFLAPKP